MDLNSEFSDGLVPFGRLLRLLRESRQLTGTELAKKAGVVRSHVCMLESGKRKPGQRTINGLRNALELKPDEVRLWDYAITEQQSTSTGKSKHLSALPELPPELQGLSSQEKLQVHINLTMRPDSPLLEIFKNISPMTSEEWANIIVNTSSISEEKTQSLFPVHGCEHDQ